LEALDFGELAANSDFAEDHSGLLKGGFYPNLASVEPQPTSFVRLTVWLPHPVARRHEGPTGANELLKHAAILAKRLPFGYYGRRVIGITVERVQMCRFAVTELGDVEPTNRPWVSTVFAGGIIVAGEAEKL
jgi:hypothetical protein